MQELRDLFGACNGVQNTWQTASYSQLVITKVLDSACFELGVLQCR